MHDPNRNGSEKDVANVRRTAPAPREVPLETVRALRAKRWIPYLFESLARDVALTVLDVRPGERVLDVHLGRGETLLKLCTLVGANGRVVGVDDDGTSRALASARLDEARLSNYEVVAALADSGSVLGRTHGRASFDAALAAFAFGHESDAETEQRLSQLRKALRPGGRLAVCGVTLGERSLPGVVSSFCAWATRTMGARFPLGMPRHVQPLAMRAGFEVDRRLYLEQRGVPSEVLLLTRPASILSPAGAAHPNAREVPR